MMKRLFVITDKFLLGYYSSFCSSGGRTSRIPLEAIGVNYGSGTDVLSYYSPFTGKYLIGRNLRSRRWNCFSQFGDL